MVVDAATVNKGDIYDLSTMAAPIHFQPQKMCMQFQREDEEFCYYTFLNKEQFVMTPTDTPACWHTMDYVKNMKADRLRLGASLPLCSTVKLIHFA